MELYQLKSFITVAEIENLTKAAQALHISQAALSTQIKSLEEEWGITLFVRNAKGMRLTLQGRKLLDCAREILTAASQLNARAFELKTSVSGTVRIGMNTDPLFLRMRELNHGLAKEFPELKIYFLQSDTLGTADMLQKNMIDIGFAYDRRWPKEITIEYLTKVEIDVTIPVVLLRNRKFPSWQDLADLPWIWADHVCPFHVYFQKELDKHGIKPKKAAFAVDEEIVMELVKDGKGLALMRHDEALRLEKEGHAVIWKKGRIQVPLQLAYLTERKEELLIRRMSRVIKEIWAKNKEP